MGKKKEKKKRLNLSKRRKEKQKSGRTRLKHSISAFKDGTSSGEKKRKKAGFGKEIFLNIILPKWKGAYKSSLIRGKKKGGEILEKGSNPNHIISNRVRFLTKGWGRKKRERMVSDSNFIPGA